MNNIDMEAKVLAVFKQVDQPLNAKEVADRAGVDKKDVDKIIKRLKAEAMIESPKRCYYLLK